MTRLTDELRRLKDDGVPWDTAWLLATANSGKHFRPTALDDGLTVPADDAPCEPMARFSYRCLRAAYLDEGRSCQFGPDSRRPGRPRL